MEQVKVKVVYRAGKGKHVLRWKDPETGAWKERVAKSQQKKEAEKEAAQLEADLREGRHETPSKLTWDDFRLLFEEQKLPSLAVNSRGAYRVALNHVEKWLRPSRVVEVDAASISRMQAKMRDSGMRETTIATYLRHLRAALSWGHELGLVTKMPKVQMPKRARRARQMKGRPITTEEYERMVEACVKVRPSDPEPWRELLQGLWLSGLRLGEALQLSWDEESSLSVDYSGEYVVLRIAAEAEKGFRDRVLPVAPEFAEWLLATPTAARRGKVLAIAKRSIKLHGVSRTICSIGETACVLVNHELKKSASAHDFRRAFGTRWASRVQPAILRELMRHQSIETTMRYYVGMQADDVAKQLQDLLRSTADAGSLGG
jgi:integrase